MPSLPPIVYEMKMIATADNATAPALNATQQAALDAYNAENHAPNILIFLGTIGAIALISVILRLWVRARILKYVGADDIVMAFAMLCGVGIYICFIGESYWGLGRHVTAVTPEMLAHFQHWSFFHNLLIIAGICLAKVSICLLLIRIVKHNAYVWSLWALLVFIVAYHIACEGTIIFSCLPISAQWNYAERATAHCFSLEVFTGLGLANSSINLITDVVLAVLPIPVIIKMQVNRRTKFALCFVLSLGFIAVGAGVVKLKAQINFLADNDKFWNDRFPIWAAVELFFAIISASLPTLRPLVVKLITTVSSSISESAARRSARRHARSTQDADNLAYGKSPATYCTECSGNIKGSPDTLSSSKDSSYFGGFVKKSSGPPSNDDEISFDNATGGAHGKPILLANMPASAPAAARDYSPASDRAYIMRTTKVSTSSEEVGPGGAVVVPSSTFTAAAWPRGANPPARKSSRTRGRPGGANMTWAGPEAEDWDAVRRPSPVAMGNNEEVVREGSVDHLVGNAR